MPDDTSSSSSLLNPLVAGMFGPNTILRTTVKLNGSNYLLWAQVFCVFVGARTNWPTYWNLHLLLLPLHMRLGFLVTIVCNVLNYLEGNVDGDVWNWKREEFFDSV